ncbi:sulfurtransferase TusA family protein [Myxococcus sp. Y35]|uniref:sulfurtransferase TusA family protein n=1 Tax=Pseudomyxococcus flavus TaxID=3115648 RepID=UPI003CF5ABF1
MDADVRIDARGTLCPMPILELAKAMRALAPGTLVEVVATDRGLEADLPAWCEATGNPLVRMERREQCYVGWVRKAG